MPEAACGPTEPLSARERWRLQHHAMRQPLNALGLFCGALQLQALTAAQQPLVNGISQAAQSLEQLVNQHFETLLDPGIPSGEPQQCSDAARSSLTVQAASLPVEVTTGQVKGQSQGEGPCRIVVVDDDATARVALAILLESWGAEVRTFSGIETLEHWLRGPACTLPDLLILDYHLPRPGDGLQALRLLHQTWPGQAVRALLITGDDRAAMANALTDGSMKCLLKPVLPAPLLAAIRQLVGPQFGV